MIAALAMGNESRGDHSHGYFAPKTGELFRALGPISVNAHRLIDKKVLFLHTRFATTGTISVENAHPFEIGNIIGQHNGIITNHSVLNNKYNRNCSVDSQHIFHHLNEDRGLDDLTGYGAINWVDKRNPGSIKLCRLQGGELSIYGIGTSPENYHGVVWSSKDEHAEVALRLSGLKFFEFEVDVGVVYEVTDEGLFVTNDKLSLAERPANAAMPDWRDGFKWQERYGISSSSKDEPDEEKEDLEEEMLRQMMGSEAWWEDHDSDWHSGSVHRMTDSEWQQSEKSREEMYSKIWDSEVQSRAEFERNRRHQEPSKLNAIDSNDYDEEYIRGKSWIKVIP